MTITGKFFCSSLHIFPSTSGTTAERSSNSPLWQALFFLIQKLITVSTSSRYNKQTHTQGCATLFSVCIIKAWSLALIIVRLSLSQSPPCLSSRSVYENVYYLFPPFSFFFLHAIVVVVASFSSRLYTFFHFSLPPFEVGNNIDYFAYVKWIFRAFIIHRRTRSECDIDFIVLSALSRLSFLEEFPNICSD